jgi:high-affinity Fe2+/Pb2+ permease
MFRFTIRDVLWLMVVVAMGCGWWFEDREWRQVNRGLMQSNSSLHEAAKGLEERLVEKEGVQGFYVPKPWVPNID